MSFNQPTKIFAPNSTLASGQPVIAGTTTIPLINVQPAQPPPPAPIPAPTTSSFTIGMIIIVVIIIILIIGVIFFLFSNRRDGGNHILLNDSFEIVRKH